MELDIFFIGIDDLDAPGMSREFPAPGWYRFDNDGEITMQDGRKVEGPFINERDARERD